MTGEVRVATRGTAASTIGSFGVELSYDPERPFEVRMVIHACIPSRWTFARSLLVEGLTRPTGEGDVAVGPAGDRLAILLCNGEQAETVYLPRHVVEVFVNATLKAVPLGSELPQLRDADLYAWLEEAS